MTDVFAPPLPMVECDACGSKSRLLSINGEMDGGWALPTSMFGYYGGFSDNVDVLLGDYTDAHINDLKICHDCVLKFLNTFPRLADKINGLSHPSIHGGLTKKASQNPLDTPSCCRYSWTAVLNGDVIQIYHGNDKGGWVFSHEDKY